MKDPRSEMVEKYLQLVVKMAEINQRDLKNVVEELFLKKLKQHPDLVIFWNIFKDKKKPHTISNLVRATKFSRLTVLKSLKKLENLNLIKREQIGRTFFYKINEGNSIIDISNTFIDLILMGLFEGTSILLARKQYSEVIKNSDAMLNIDSNYAPAWLTKGSALLELGQYDEALKTFEKAIEIKPDLAEAWYNKGVALAHLARYDEANKAFKKAIEIKPDLAKPYIKTIHKEKQKHTKFSPPQYKLSVPPSRHLGEEERRNKAKRIVYDILNEITSGNEQATEKFRDMKHEDLLPILEKWITAKLQTQNISFKTTRSHGPHDEGTDLYCDIILDDYNSLKLSFQVKTKSDLEKEKVSQSIEGIDLIVIVMCWPETRETKSTISRVISQLSSQSNLVIIEPTKAIGIIEEVQEKESQLTKAKDLMAQLKGSLNIKKISLQEIEESLGETL